MKHFALLTILFSLQAFSHEIESHPEHLIHSCNFDEALYISSDSDDFEKELHHYLDQNCDFSIIEDPSYPITRMERVLRMTFWNLYTSVLKRLINEFHMNTNIPILYFDDIKFPPLYFAITSFHDEANYPYRKKDHKEAFEFFELLLKSGADVNWQDEVEETILIHAIKSSGNRSIDLIKLFIKYGAKLDVEDFTGFTAKDYLGFAPSTEYDPDWYSSEIIPL